MSRHGTHLSGLLLDTVLECLQRFVGPPGLQCLLFPQVILLIHAHLADSFSLQQVLSLLLVVPFVLPVPV